MNLLYGYHHTGELFSNAVTLTDENPQKMELSYDTNPGTNYIASKMSGTAMGKDRKQYP